MVAVGSAPIQTPYQAELRLLGAYLDHEQPWRFTLVEGTNGFYLLLQRSSDSTDREEVRFSHEGIEQQVIDIVGRHGRIVPEHNWRLSARSRQDFLRALGYELDDAQAHTITLDELSDSMVLTYSYLDPNHGYSWRKRSVQLGKSDIDQIVQVAHARRRPVRKRLFGR